MFCADLRSGQDIFALRGIDRERGCMVVVRPDQYIAHVVPLDGFEELAAFFDGFMMVDLLPRPALAGRGLG
jgi:phenol 2-monooxygenase (NADPH)